MDEEGKLPRLQGLSTITLMVLVEPGLISLSPEAKVNTYERLTSRKLVRSYIALKAQVLNHSFVSVVFHSALVSLGQWAVTNNPKISDAQ